MQRLLYPMGAPSRQMAPSRPVQMPTRPATMSVSNRSSSLPDAKSIEFLCGCILVVGGLIYTLATGKRENYDDKDKDKDN